MIKRVIFDFDGTIADSTAVFRSVTNDVTDKFNMPRFTDEEYAHLSSIPIKQAIKELNIKWYQVPKFSIEGGICFMKRIHTVPLFDDVVDLLATLKKSELHMSIISSNSTENIKHFVKINDLNYFDDIIACQKLFKKHVFIKRFLKSKKLKPKEVIYVGDEVRDIQACKKANIKVIAASWGFDSLSDLQDANPDFIAHKPMDVYEIIDDFIEKKEIKKLKKLKKKIKKHHEKKRYS